jgi:hypothetical protein
MLTGKMYSRDYIDNDKIAVHEADFERLCDAFFDDIEAKCL